MSRKARIDAPGALHHIIVRGIERRKIFLDDFDHDNFLKRPDNVLSEIATPCFARALIPNHAHLFLRVSRHHRHCHGCAQAFDRLCGQR
jgi:REP element-mobilizing transposase RayT